MAAVPDVTDLDIAIAAGDAFVRRLRQQRRDVIRRRRQERIDREDTALVWLIEHHVHVGVLFWVETLMAHAVHHPELAAAIADATPIALGRRLARIVRRGSIAGLVLECVSRTEDGYCFVVRSTA